ncbi:MAG: hypothetical protein OHK0022_20300 [Roseiflexaceae bacterium]
MTTAPLTIPGAAVGLLCRPGPTLHTLAQMRRHWLAPLGLALGGMLVLSAGYLEQSTAAIQAALPGLTGTELPGWSQAPALVWAFSLLGVLASVGGYWLLQSALLAALSRMGRRPLGLRAVLALMPWLALPIALRMALHGGYMLLGGTILDNGLSFLVNRAPGQADLGHLGWQLLWQIDLFFVWHVALAGAALHRFAGLTRSRAIDAALIYGLVVAVVQAGVSILFGT